MIGLMDRCSGSSHFQLSKLSKSFKNSTDNQDNNLYVGACRRRCLYLLYRLSILGPIISISYLVSEFCPVDDIVFVCFLEFLNFDIDATLHCIDLHNVQRKMPSPCLVESTYQLHLLSRHGYCNK